MTSFFRLIAGLCALIFTLGPAAAEDRITVFAAASLRGALEDVLEHGQIDANVSYSGSGVLARQVAQGAPADVVIIANRAWMDWLEEANRLADGSRFDLLGNRLVLVAPIGASPLDAATPDTVLKRLGGGRLAVGHTQAVPAGIYAKEWMQAVGLWQDLRPHLAETENVRAALALVARKEVPLAVVYASDAQAEPAAQVVWSVDPETHSEIVYPMAIVAGRERDAVSDLVKVLKSPAAAKIFRGHGFLTSSGS